MNDNLEIKASKKHTLFIPAFIDDYGFTPEEFRVFSRIMRRSLGSDKGCFESVPQMAESLQISERLIKRAFKVLTACNAVTREERKGKTDVFEFNTCDKWKPASELAAIRSKIDEEIKRADRERKEKAKTQVGAETPPVSGCGNAPSVGAETQGVVGAESTDEGTEDKSSYPNEGNPPKVGVGNFDDSEESFGTGLNNLGAQQKLHAWLDAVAACFKTTRHALADLRRWENVCIKGIDSNLPQENLITALKTEINRNITTPHYLSPEKVLQIAQLASFTVVSTFKNEFTGRGLK